MILALKDSPPPSNQGYAEFHTDTTVCFVVRLTAQSAQWNDDKIEKNFKLAKYVSLGNMHLYDKTGRLQSYKDSLAILQEFYDIRLDWYKKRRVCWRRPPVQLL